MKEEGLFGSVDLACLRGCLCLCACACVNGDMFIVKSAIQRAIAFILPAT